MAPPIQWPHPRNLEEFARGGWPQYIERVCSLVGVPRQEVEDVAAEIVLYVIERDALAKYRPDVAPFAAFLRAYVVKRCRSWSRDRRKQIAELTLSAPVSNAEDVDLIQEDLLGVDDPLIDYVCSYSRLVQFEGWLRAREEDDLVDLYGSLVWNVVQAPTVGGADSTRFDMAGYGQLRYRLAQDLGVQKPTVDRWMSRLKKFMVEFGLFDRG